MGSGIKIYPDIDKNDMHVAKLVRNFFDTGCVCNVKHKPQHSIGNNAVEVVVLGHAHSDYTQSINQLAQTFPVRLKYGF